MKLALWAVALLTGCTLAAQNTSLTIYNQNFGLVRETVSLNLSPGINDVRFTEITALVEPDSVVLRDPTMQRSLQVLEQNYRADPITQEALLSLYEGQTIDFQVDTTKIVKGKIIRSGYIPRYGQYQQASYQQPLIEVNGQLRFGLPGLPLFPALTGDTILKPALAWQVRTDKPGQFDAELSYVTGGMGWEADYNLVAPAKGDILDLVGWITINNRTGHVFENANIRLLAGDVNKIETNDYRNFQAAAAKARAEEAMSPVVTERAFDEYHLYTLAHPTTLHDQETKQVEFVRGTGVVARKLYVYDGANLDWNQYRYWSGESIRGNRELGTQCNKKVWVMTQFTNSGKNGLGIPLPKGKLRFYRRDIDGSLQFTGESLIDHTPKDELIRVYTGNAFDLVGERKRTNYIIDTNKDFIDESFEIRLRNRKKEPVTFTVVERLYRGLNWRIAQESHTHRKTDAQQMEFQVTVQPNAEQIVTYSVHYTW
ncbi:MAG TPA: hypothetical protein VN577_01400 [Terriglobales bacterium]|nr:hypothetical protein [Terriglobales bacterium]